MEVTMFNNYSAQVPIAVIAASLAMDHAGNVTNSTLDADIEAKVSTPAKVVQTWADNEISKLLKLREKWSQFDADPLKISTISQLRALLHNAQNQADVRGQIVPGADGSVQAEWHLDELSIGLLVEEDGIFSSWARFHKDGTQIEEFGQAGLELLRSLATAYRLNV